jgi:tetratricopeptide (TPR) repeat protein
MMIEMQDVDRILRQVEDLKRRSRRLRDSEDFERAAEALQRAINLIEPQIKTYDLAFKAAGGSASQDLRDLAAQLADCYGSMAGIRRRQGNLQEALEFYSKGRELEQTRAYGINNTYNQVQWLILRVLLNPQLILDKNPSFMGEIADVLRIFDEQIRKNPDDPWVRSDKGLLQTVIGEEALAQESWDEMDAGNPIPSVYKSGLSVLETLARALPGHRGLENAVTHFRTKTGSQG